MQKIPDPNSPAGLKQRIKSLGITQAQFARIANVQAHTVRRYLMAPDKNDARPMHPTVRRVLEWLESGYRPPEWPGA